jgi:uncharacterized protein
LNENAKLLCALTLAVCIVVALIFGGYFAMRKEPVDQMGRIALHYAAVNGDLQEITDLIAAGSDVNARDNAGMTPLHFASQQQHFEAARLLLGAGAKVDVKDNDGNTPLNRAASFYSGEKRLIPMLLKRGADPNGKNNYGVSPIEIAETSANPMVITLFGEAK